MARLGGDEFAVVVDHAGDPDALMRKCMEICARLGQPYQLTANGDAFEARVGASIGAAVYPQHGATRDSLIQAADDAMYAAKRAGKNSGQLAVTQRG